MDNRPRPVVLVMLTLVAIVAGILLARLSGVGVEPTPEPTGTAAAAISVATGIPTGATEATIEYVHDGDTVFLEDGRKVRLLGVNTPEIGENAECYGEEATALTRRLLPEDTHVWVLPDVEALDQYGRSLLFIYTDDATNINLELLEQGAAEVEMYEPNVMFRSAIEAAESGARAAGRGMWGSC